MIDKLLTNNLYIEKSNENDLQRIKELYEGQEFYGIATNEKVFDNMKYNDIITLTVKKRNSNSLIGLVKIYIPNRQNNVCWLQLLMIKQRYRRKGYGREIYKIIEKSIVGKDCLYTIYLSVIDGNHIAMLFWEKMGFGRIKTYDDKYIINDIEKKIHIYKKEIRQNNEGNI